MNSVYHVFGTFFRCVNCSLKHVDHYIFSVEDGTLGHITAFKRKINTQKQLNVFFKKLAYNTMQ